jgi:methylenetetrahydrofolate dehydrogenase (NADP+)/methenyltetrahydrofolate cyclohydrolase
LSARLLDGRDLARRLAPALRTRVAALPRPPGLAVVLVGEDPASAVYVERKHERAERLGFHQATIRLPVDTPQGALEALIDELNVDPRIDGVLVQLPLPSQIDAGAVLGRILPEKDVDGFHVVNTGRLSQGLAALVPCTPLGVMRLIADAGLPLAGCDALVVGRSNIVGRPMAMLLEQAHATVTLAHSRTRNLEDHVRRADLVVAAVGRPDHIRGAWIKPGAVVIDVGINRLADGSLVGDVEFGPAAARAGAITPVPGGVGPMTIAMLMENTVTAAERRQGLAR